MDNQENKTILKISLLEEKVKKLVSERISVKNMLINLKNENEKLQICLNEQNEDLKNFQNQLKITKIANVTADNTKSTVELRMLLNQYIREIDKCIAHLSE